ncbi:hypothetical protein [Hansschlegelia plantiphila]|nr:hypothetical protein [Hansschlegelia plantiphila]
MLGWFVRLSLGLASLITGLFVAKDAVNFGIVNVMVAVLLLTAVISVLAFWPMISTGAMSAYRNFLRRP